MQFAKDFVNEDDEPTLCLLLCGVGVLISDDD